MNHFVYIIYSETTDSFYIGETSNVQERINRHNSGIYNSAYSKLATDWKLFWFIECETRGQALKIEKHIKKMRNRDFYKNLVLYPEISLKLLYRYSS
jgi:putative endonuclease